MDSRIAQLLDKEIGRREEELTALRQARAALSGASESSPRRGRRTFTAAQRAAISRRMKATWAARRASKKKSER